MSRGAAVRFRDRQDAGRSLAEALREDPATAQASWGDVVVAGLPRGGVPVAAEVAAALDANLDVIIVRKLGVPQQPELGFGAVGEHGVRVLRPDIVTAAHLRDEQIAAVEAREREAVEQRAARWRAGGAASTLRGKTVVIVDDGLATGSTARAAGAVARAAGAASVVLAVPVAPPETVARLASDFDAIVCVALPEDFAAVGQFYDDFDQTSDDEVTRLLLARSRRPEGPPGE